MVCLCIVSRWACCLQRRRRSIIGGVTGLGLAASGARLGGASSASAPATRTPRAPGVRLATTRRTTASGCRVGCAPGVVQDSMRRGRAPAARTLCATIVREPGTTSTPSTTRTFSTNAYKCQTASIPSERIDNYDQMTVVARERFA